MNKHCPRGKKPVPTNKTKYNKIKQKVKSTAEVWPSAYASGRVVRLYKQQGGKYICSFGDLQRWFMEKWVNVCKPTTKGKYEKCSRNSTKQKYPYCRPSKRVNSKTPKTVYELTPKQRKTMCRKKKKNVRVSLR